MPAAGSRRAPQQGGCWDIGERRDELAPRVDGPPRELGGGVSQLRHVSARLEITHYGRGEKTVQPAEMAAEARSRSSSGPVAGESAAVARIRRLKSQTTEDQHGCRYFSGPAGRTSSPRLVQVSESEGSGRGVRTAGLASFEKYCGAHRIACLTRSTLPPDPAGGELAY